MNEFYKLLCTSFFQSNNPQYLVPYLNHRSNNNIDNLHYILDLHYEKTNQSAKDKCVCK